MALILKKKTLKDIFKNGKLDKIQDSTSKSTQQTKLGVLNLIFFNLKNIKFFNHNCD